MGKRSRILAAFLAMLMMVAFIPAMTQEAYSGEHYEVDFTEHIMGLKDGKIEQGSTISLNVEKVIESYEAMMESYMEYASFDVMLMTYSPSGMHYFDYDNSTGIATLNVSADKANAGSKVNVIIDIGGSSGELFFSQMIEVVEQPAVEPTPVTPTPAVVTPVVPVEIQDLPAVKIAKPAAAKKSVNVKWKKVSKKNQKKIGGIEIQVATDSDFTDIVKSTTAGKKKASKKIKGLKSKKTYWVRIRAYKNAADGKHVSAWKTKKFKSK